MSKRLRRLSIALITIAGLTLGAIQPVLAAEPTLTGLTLAPGIASVTADQSLTFTLTGTYSDASTATVTELATWQANGAGFTGIPGQKGAFTAVASGTWLVTAAIGSLSASATVTVTHGNPVGLNLMPTPATLTTDDTAALRLFAVDADGNGWEVTSTATWSTNEPTGIVSASGYQPVTPGVWTVSASFATYTVSRSFTVQPGAVASLAISPSIAPTVGLGKTFLFTSQAHDADGNLLTPTITWSVTNPDVGSITTDGIFTAEGAGQTNVTVSVGGRVAIVPVIVPGVAVLTEATDPEVVAVARPTTQARTPRVAADEVEVQPEITATQTTIPEASVAEQEANFPHPWVIVLIIAHVLSLVGYFTWLMRKPMRWWWAPPVATTAALLAIYSSAFTEATYLWWPWTIIGLTIIFISVYYQRYGTHETSIGKDASPPGTPPA